MHRPTAQLCLEAHHIARLSMAIHTLRKQQTDGTLTCSSSGLAPGALRLLPERADVICALVNESSNETRRLAQRSRTAADGGVGSAAAAFTSGTLDCTPNAARGDPISRAEVASWKAKSATWTKEQAGWDNP
jgi:hypothetical protein